MHKYLEVDDQPAKQRNTNQFPSALSWKIEMKRLLKKGMAQSCSLAQAKVPPTTGLQDLGPGN